MTPMQVLKDPDFYKAYMEDANKFFALRLHEQLLVYDGGGFSDHALAKYVDAVAGVLFDRLVPDNTKREMYLDGMKKIVSSYLREWDDDDDPSDASVAKELRWTEKAYIEGNKYSLKRIEDLHVLSAVNAELVRDDGFDKILEVFTTLQTFFDIHNPEYNDKFRGWGNDDAGGDIYRTASCLVYVLDNLAGRRFMQQ
tara:strand:+ start:15931 stop:16521 length:591 start_codon:yes stop_codon:yes gene_type:complete